MQETRELEDWGMARDWGLTGFSDLVGKNMESWLYEYYSYYVDIMDRMDTMDTMDIMDSIWFYYRYYVDIMDSLDWFTWIGFRCFFFLFGVFGARRLRLVWSHWDLPALENGFLPGKQHIQGKRNILHLKKGL